MNLATLLTLTRPLAVLDLETTGFNPEQDRIVQIAITIHYPNKEPIVWSALVNPEMPIPPEVIEVHHITDEMVKECFTFKQMATKLSGVLSNVDFCGYFVTFDLKFMRAEMKRAGISWEYTDALVIDAMNIYRNLHPRNLSAAYERFLGKKFEGAHDAGNDVEATVEVLAAQLLQNPNIPRTMPELAAYCFPKAKDAVDNTRKFYWRNGEACFAFGKHQGTELRKMNKGYLKWMMNGNFPLDTRRIVQDALDGKYPVKEAPKKE